MGTFDPNEYEPRESFEVSEGDYTFLVFAAEDKTSSKDNEMIALELHFDIDRDDPLNVYAHLVFIKSCLYQVAGFCAATGLQEKFDSGELVASDCEGMQGIAHLNLGKANDDGKRYMQVQYYVKPEGFTEQPGSGYPAKTNEEAKKLHEETVKKPIPKDDIPF